MSLRPDEEIAPPTMRSAEDRRQTSTSKRVVSLALPSSFPPNQSRPTAAALATGSESLASSPPHPGIITNSNFMPFPVKNQSATLQATSHRRLSITKGLPPRFRKPRCKTNTMANSLMKDGGAPGNVLQWLEACCPKDVVPKVLTYCRPQTTSTLMATNRYWFQMIAHNEATWRCLCEGMYKWTEGQDDTPTSWKEYYRLHPCVPVDYSSIPRALAVATDKNSGSGYSQYIRSPPNGKKEEQVRSVEVLLRPGKHYIKEALIVQAEQDITVTLRTMKLPENRFYSPRLAFAEQEHPQSVPESGKSKARNTSFRHWMGCKNMHGAVQGCSSPLEDMNSYDSDASEANSIVLVGSRVRSFSTGDSNRIPFASTLLMPPPRYPSRAMILLKTRRQNEPIVRVRQGAFKLVGVDLEHACLGVDIWSGNAAVQVQPPLGPNNEPILVVPRPSASLQNVAISSRSGRGVVCLDGGRVLLRDSMIHDCAATGLYVGGSGSEAEMWRTDVIRNGIGSRLPASRLPRVSSGHSGVYLEQGLARINECNISSNYLTGISAVSFEKAFLHLSKSDLVANGQGNLEVPPQGTVAYDKSVVSKDNNMADVGRPCLRSNLELPARSRDRASF